MTRHALLAASLLLACASASAQSRLKAGLWEYTITVASQSGQIERAMAEAQAQIARLPPAERQRIEAMMAARGTRLGAPGTNATTQRVCLSATDAERGNVQLQVGDCTQNVVSRDGDTQKLSFVCLSDPPTTGTGELRVLGPTSHLATARVDTSVNGKPDRVDTTQRGQWIADDCGGLPPAGN